MNRLARVRCCVRPLTPRRCGHSVGRVQRGQLLLAVISLAVALGALVVAWRAGGGPLAELTTAVFLANAAVRYRLAQDGAPRHQR